MINVGDVNEVHTLYIRKHNVYLVLSIAINFDVSFIA